MIKKESKKRSRLDRGVVYEEIKERRQRLLVKIEEFNEEALLFLQFKNNPHVSKTQQSTPRKVDIWETDEEEDEDEEDEEGKVKGGSMQKVVDDDDEEPENMDITLPSTKIDQLTDRNRSIIDKEIKLRTGQANDALSQIRTGVCHRTFLAREKHRQGGPERTTKVTTRSSAAHAALTAKINEHVGKYELAFDALSSLGAKGDFQEIRREHLKTIKDISQPNQVGQSKETLSWIWKAGAPSEYEAKKEWMNNGMDHFIIGKHTLNIFFS
jgi:hypothetical protein